MTKTAIREQVQAFEKNMGGTFPPVYKRFLIEEVGDWPVYELSWQSGSEEQRMDVYSVEEVFERNEAYEVQQWASGYWLIGQDDDLGYFIRIAPVKRAMRYTVWIWGRWAARRWPSTRPASPIWRKQRNCIPRSDGSTDPPRL